MVAVTQRVDNYLGGVSRQSDDKKFPGQVKECLNGYPDPTFGLTKRPGFKWIANLGTGTTFDNCKWFYIARTATERYIGCIQPALGGSTGDIKIWNTDGTACNVTYGTGAQAYLTGARTNYDILTVQDTSIITNNLITTAKIADPTFVAKTRATLVLTGSVTNGVDTYDVTINGTAITQVAPASGDGYDDVLGDLKTNIDALNVSGLTVTRYANSLELTRVVSGTRTAFTISAKGGIDNSKLTVFQDQVDNVSQLPTQSFQDHVVKIINTASANDTYFAKFVADDGTSGTGYWSETLDPSKSTGLNQDTMPHELINSSANNFVFQKITWTSRTVGDDVTNSHPSFVGQKIQQAFFHNNRLGFLSKDNVSMSQSQDFYNFYHTSAQTVTDADPVDLSCSTIRPAALHAVIPTTQGLVLFAKNQQFMMFAADGILTPTSSLIRTISNYEMDTEVDPVDIGTNINFISKTPSYTRIFGMVTRGQDENPQVLDVGRVVNEWVPATVDTFIASPQNQFLAMSSQSSDKVYFYRTYSDGKENLVEAWFNWQLMGTVQTIAVDSDDMFAVTKQGNQFTLSQASLSQSPEDAIIVNNQGQRVNPCIDLFIEARNAAGNATVTFDATNNFSKCFIPFANVTTLTPILIIKGSTQAGTFVESGFTVTPTVVTDDGDPYFKVSGKDLTSVATSVMVGWKYKLDVTLPRTYFRTDEKMSKTDFTASLTIARMKFAVGLSGVMSFKLKSTGIRQGSRSYTGDGSTRDFNWIKADLDYIDREQVKIKINNVVTTAFVFNNDTSIKFNTAPADGDDILIYLEEWYSLNPTQKAGTYLADDVALDDLSVFTVPIHQKSENFILRVVNDSPFPVSLNSMMWEGNYSPRFYGRK